jgi:hypothetical protein
MGAYVLLEIITCFMASELKYHFQYPGSEVKSGFCLSGDSVSTGGSSFRIAKNIKVRIYTKRVVEP